ncbi:MAG: hypothetical protein HUJ31_04380 [Pseudomonadales bacterium]|nr:hypothetical protein [Pseudomonadales bacterium]
MFSSLILIDTLLMGSFFGIDKLQKRIEQTDIESDTRVYGNKLALEFITNMIAGDETPAQATDVAEPAPETATQTPPATTTPESTTERRSTRTEPSPKAAPATLPDVTLPTASLIAGTGAGTYYTFFPLYRDENVSQQNVHAHNDFFEFGLEFGAIGSLMLIAVIVLTMVTAIRAQTSRHTRLMQAMGFAGMMAIFSLMIHSFTDFNLQIYANAVTYLAILALPFIAIATNRHGNAVSS